MFEFINDLITQQESRGVVPKSKYRTQKTSFRQSLIELANAENAKVPAERRVSHRTVLTVAERSLGSTGNLDKSTRRFIAYKEAASFVTFATTGDLTNTPLEKYYDLLPVGHPLSTRAHRMSEAAINSATARWFAADPRIDDSVRELVASAYESPLGSIEYRHSVARINALTAGLVPRDILLNIQPTAITAAGGNSSAARSARAKLQRRDRKGQFAYQGGGFQFFIRGLGGKISSVTGRFVANSDKTDGFQIEVKKDKVLQDGLYDIPASKAEAIIAVLPDAPQNEEVNLPSGVEAVNLAEIKPLDAPAGWELISTKKPGETGPDKVFKSGDGYIVEYYAPGNESTKKAAQAAWNDNQLAGQGAGLPKIINSNGETGPIKGKLQSDAPVYILKRDPEAGETKSRKRTVAITQSWADTQNEAGNDEKLFDDDIKAKIDQDETIAKNQKASLEKNQKAKAEQDKANQPIFDKNAEIAEDIQANLDAGRDANGNDLPEGWTANKKELNIMRVDPMTGNAVPIDPADAADYSKENQGIKMSVSLNEDGSLNFNGQTFEDWDAVADAEPDYVKGKIDENRNAVKEAIKGYDPDGKVADIIDAGGGPDEIEAELENNAAWVSRQKDLETSWAVESPSAAQKESWAKLEKINKSIREILPAYNDSQKATLPPREKLYGEDSIRMKMEMDEKAKQLRAAIDKHMDDKATTEDRAMGISEVKDFIEAGLKALFKKDKKNAVSNLQDAYDIASGDESPSEGSFPRGEYAGEATQLLDEILTELEEDAGDLPDTPPAESPVEPQPTSDSNKQQNFADKFIPSPKAWKLLNVDKFEPQGRDGEESTDFTDDPEVIAGKFGEDALVDGFIQAIVGKKDYALDLLEDDEDEEELDEDGEPVKKKGKPGPKKKKPTQEVAGSGQGQLEFNQGEEWVTAEALYLALKNQGYDVDLLLAQLYDAGLGENKNQQILKSLRKEENVQAETPLLDAIDYDDPEILARVNVDVALDDSMGAIMVELLEFNKNGEPNAKIVELSDAIRKASAGAPVNDTDMQIPEGLVGLIDDFIKGALDENATPDEKQAWQALWATIVSLDEGASDGIEETRLALGVFDAITKYNGTAEWSDVKEFFDKNGGVKELIRSKKAIVDRNESITDDDSFAGAYFRLVAESSRYNDVSLFRGVQVPTDSPLLEKLQVGKTVTFDARPFSTDQNFALIFAGAVNSLTDKVAVVFTIKPLKGKSADLSKVSPFNELEHKVAGNFKVVGVKERKNTGGKTVFEVEVEMMSKRDAVLDGTDSDFNDLLMKENVSPEMPEGYHQIDTEPYQSTGGEGYPADFEDKPDVIARNYSRDDLVDVFRGGIENGTGEATLNWDETEVSVPVELIRDALQVQGLDTNSILEDIANADPAAGELVDEDEMEAAEQDVDNPINEIIDDIGDEYDMAGWRKTGPQLGSNEGGFYEDAEGNRYYVKKPKSELHAENEVLAAAFYRLFGIDAAQVNIGSGEDGAKMTFSPDITDAKQDLQEKLNDPEFMAKLQEGFAIDAWLGNWDVAGLVFDNVMSDADGNPVRVDPGGALLFRAMGAPKGSLFGSEVNELDTLRDPDMNPQSFAVFGSMTEEQQKESARKLLDISNDDIDAMVDGRITDADAAEELKTKLKARRQFILERYDLLSEDTSVIVDNADISEEQDADPEAVSTPEGKSAEVDSRLDIARSWAEEYAEDMDITSSARKKFKAVADQIDKVLVDWRNGEISDEDLPGVLDELSDMIDFGKIGDDTKLLNNIDDLDEQIMNLKEYIEGENKKNAPEPEVVETPVEVAEPEVAEPTASQATDKNGTPILPGAKLRYEKKGEILEGVFSRYNKAPGYVWIKLSTGGKPKVFSTKFVTVIDGDGGGGEDPKAPEAPESPEPQATETPTPDITPDEDIEPETETDIGQFDSTDAQLTKDGKVRVSFIVDGNRPFNPKGDGPAGYEEVLPYVVNSKLDVDGVDEVTVEVPLDKMDDFVKEYEAIFDEKLNPAEFFDDIYTDYQEPKPEDSAKSTPEPEVKTKEELPEFSREGWTRSVTPDQEVLGVKIDNSNRIIFDKKQENGSSLRIAVNKDTLEDPKLREGLEDFFTAIDDLHKRYPIDGLVIGINNPDPDEPEVLGTTVTLKGEKTPVIMINKEVLTKKQRLSVEHVAAHEYGHALDPRTEEEAEKGLEEFKSLMTPTFNEFPMTEYGLTSGREAFAEAFAAFYVRKYGKPFDANAPKTSYTQSQKVFQNDKFWENTIKHFNIEDLATKFERSAFKVEDTFDADNPATLEEGEPKLNLYAQDIKDILKKQGTEISNQKAIEIRDAIEENDLIDKWSSATEEDILAAILDVVGPGIVDLVDEDLDAVDEEPESAITTEKPFGDDSSVTNLNTAADMLIKTFVHGMPFGGKLVAVNEQSGTIAVTPDGKEVYLFDGKENVSFIAESDISFFEPGGDGGKFFKWRPLSEEENAAMMKKIEDNAVPYGTPPAEEEDAEIDSPETSEEEEEATVTATEPPANAVTAADSTGTLIWAGVKVTDKKGASGTVIKVNKDGYAVVDFGDGALKWRSAKTLNSTGKADQNFQGATPKGKTAKTAKATGAGAPPVIVDSPVDWELSNFAEVPSLPKAIEAALNMDDKSAAMRGASAAVDADSIEELDVRVMHVRTVDGQDSIQLKFKLTNWAGKKRIDEINKMNLLEQSEAGVSIEQLRIPKMEVGADGVGQMTSEYSYTNGSGRTYTITTKDGIVIRIHRANNENYTKVSNDAQARAFHNMVQIEAPVGATDDQIANALAIAGVSEVRPATPADAQILIENRLMSILDAKTDANTNPKGEKREESLEKVKSRYGITVDDVIVTTGASGRIEYRLTPEGAEKIWKATGSPEVLNHDLRMPDIFDMSMSNEQRAEAMTNWLVNLIASPQGGLLSTTTRWTEGIGGNGQSSWTDVGTGGADYVFTKPRRNADKKIYGTSSWLPTLYFDPKKLYERLDFYANEKDKFGKRQKSKDIISAAKVGAYEVMFKQRLAWDDLDVMVVSKEIHVGVIEGLKARGIDTIGGRPIEEVIIVGGTK